MGLWAIYQMSELLGLFVGGSRLSNWASGQPTAVRGGYCLPGSLAISTIESLSNDNTDCQSECLANQ